GERRDHRGDHTADRVPVFGLSPAQCLLSHHRPPGAGPGLTPGCDPGRETAQAGGRNTALPVPARGGGAPVGGVARGAPVRVLCPPGADAPGAEAETSGTVSDLAAGADGAAASPLCRRGPALGRPFDARVPHAAGGAGANGAALGPADLSARVSTAVGLV